MKKTVKTTAKTSLYALSVLLLPMVLITSSVVVGLVIKNKKIDN